MSFDLMPPPQDGDPSLVFGQAQAKRILLAVFRNQCQGCFHCYPDKELEVDHIMPRTDGLNDHLTNLTLLCQTCNKNKSNRLTLSGLREKNYEEGRLAAGWHFSSQEKSAPLWARAFLDGRFGLFRDGVRMNLLISIDNKKVYYKIRGVEGKFDYKILEEFLKDEGEDLQKYCFKFMSGLGSLPVNLSLRRKDMIKNKNTFAALDCLNHKLGRIKRDAAGDIGFWPDEVRMLGSAWVNKYRSQGKADNDARDSLVGLMGSFLSPIIQEKYKEGDLQAILAKSDRTGKYDDLIEQIRS